MQHTLNNSGAIEIAQLSIPNGRQASLFIRYGATLDNGSLQTTSTGQVALDIDSDSSGNLSLATTSQNTGAIHATNPAQPFYLSFNLASGSGPIVAITAQVAGYGGGSASGEVRFTIEDIWGNGIEEL